MTDITAAKVGVSPTAEKAPGSCTFCAGYLWGPDPNNIDGPFLQCPICWPKSRKPTVERANPAYDKLRWDDAVKRWPAKVVIQGTEVRDRDDCIRMGTAFIGKVAPFLGVASTRPKLKHRVIFYGLPADTQYLTACLLNETSVRTGSLCGFYTASMLVDFALDKDKTTWQRICSPDMLAIVVTTEIFSGNPLLRSKLGELFLAREQVGCYTILTMEQNPAKIGESNTVPVPLVEFIKAGGFKGIAVPEAKD